jgi:hypothetical protein
VKIGQVKRSLNGEIFAQSGHTVSNKNVNVSQPNVVNMSKNNFHKIISSSFLFCFSTTEICILIRTQIFGADKLDAQRQLHLLKWRHDAQQYDTQQNNTQHNKRQCNYTQHRDTQPRV